MRRGHAAAGTAAFFVVAPCVVAGLVPFLLSGWTSAVPPPPAAVRVAAALLLAGCVALLVACFVRFVREGGGTPAPPAPTQRLVVGGAYRYVRNPMYVAVVGAVLAQALLLGSVVLAAYAAAVWAVVASFVHWYEEPVLTRQYGAEYARYRDGVRAWIPRLTPWSDGGT